MKTDRIGKRLKQGKKLKKIYRRINTKFSLAKRKNPKCTNKKKETIFKPLEATEKTPKRKITNVDC